MIATFLGTVLLLVIVYFFIWLFRNIEAKGAARERKTFTYNQIAEDYDYWNKYVNYDLEDNEQMTRSAFAKLSIEEKTQMLIARFGKEKAK